MGVVGGHAGEDGATGYGTGGWGVVLVGEEYLGDCGRDERGDEEIVPIDW